MVKIANNLSKTLGYDALASGILSIFYSFPNYQLLLIPFTLFRIKTPPSCPNFQGNALGQVASQTTENIRVTHLISPLPLINPLFGYNKDHIIKISSSIGTYGPRYAFLIFTFNLFLSLIFSTCGGTNDCCIMYMPKNPKTRANYELVLNFISKVPVSLVNEVSFSTI